MNDTDPNGDESIEDSVPDIRPDLQAYVEHADGGEIDIGSLPIDPGQIVESTQAIGYREVPIAQLLDKLGVVPEKPMELPRQWHMARISLDVPMQDLVWKMNTFGGQLAQILFNSGERADGVFLFPNEAVANNALQNLRTDYPDHDIYFGVSGGEPIYTVVTHGTVAFFGHGAERAYHLEDKNIAVDPMGPSAMSDFFEDTAQLDPESSKILPTLKKIPTAMKSAGAAVNIVLPADCINEHGELIEPLHKLLDLADHRRSTFQWCGNVLTITSVSDEPMASIMLAVKKVIDEEIKKGRHFAAYGAHGTFDVVIPRPNEFLPRQLHSAAFVELAQMPLMEDKDGELAPCLWVRPNDAAELEKPRGGLIIKKATPVPTRAGTLMHLDDIEPRVTTLVVRVAKDVLGRDEELEYANKLVMHVMDNQGVVVWRIKGKAGMGKSTLADEVFRRANRHYSNLITIEAKASSNEQRRDFAFANLFISELLAHVKQHGYEESQFYKILAIFVRAHSDRGFDEDTELINTLPQSPDFIVQQMRDLIYTIGQPLLIALDDLQFTDAKSNLIIAKFIGILHTLKGIFFTPIARSGEQEMPLIIRKAMEDFEIKTRTSEKLKTRTEEVTPLEFFKKSEAETMMPTELLRNFFKSCILGNHDEEDIPDHILVRLFSRVVTPDGFGNPFEFTQIILSLLEHKNISLNEEGRINYKGIEDIKPETLAMQNVLRSRFEHLQTNYPRLLEVMCRLVLFPSGVTQKLFESLFPDDLRHEEIAQLQEMFFIALRGGKVDFVHDLMREHAEDFFPRDKADSIGIFHTLQNVVRGNPLLAREIPPGLHLELLKPAIEDGVQERVRGYDYKELRRLALKHGLADAKILNSGLKPTEAMEILEWIVDNLLKGDKEFGSLEQRMEIMVQLGRSYSLNGNYDKVPPLADKALDLLDRIMSNYGGADIPSHFARWQLELCRDKCRAYFRLNKPDALNDAVAEFRARLIAKQTTYSGDNFLSFRLEQELYAGIAIYLPASTKKPLEASMAEFNKALTMLSTTVDKIQNALATIEGMPQTHASQRYIELQQLYFEARRIYASVLQYKEVHKIQSLGDEDAFLAITREQLPSSTEPAMEQSKGIVQKLIEDFYNSKIPLLADADGKQLGALHYLSARAELLCDGDYDSAMKSLDEAARVTMTNWLEHAFFLQRKADFQFMWAKRHGTLLTLSAIAEISNLYKTAMTTLDVMDRTKQAKAIDARYRITADNFAGFVLYMANLDELMNTNNVDGSLLQEAWYKFKLSLWIYSEDQVTNIHIILQYLVPKLGDFLHYSKKLGIKLPEIDEIVSNVSGLAGESQAHIEKVIDGLHAKNTPDAVRTELALKLRGAKRLVQHVNQSS